ncbi:WD40 repeat domain-containing protein [Phytohabitans rumicis]|uniref:Uncharacterized protein n=1 Tax=Phytohabitans rumicis TaxID=1076125 RepID=A0A6V8KXD7_9ACTN|nr:WD40 repeat domain-containing protein [Phytohabitans rumicis]GFJ87091.1 hypothetical protein Prum_007330 [Phytohabitans rumicis]GFJ87669.1 hypothetical protein Prum_013110 [Phytohabitans rumicis]
MAVLTAPALAAALILGSLSSQWLTGWPGWPGNPDVSATVSTRWWADTDTDTTLPTPDGSVKLMIIGAACVVPGLIFALLALLTRAWPRFTLTRVLLAGQGRLPLRLLSFLADARDRQLLRQSGGAYQFRHVRLQERLADQSTATPDIPGRATPATPGSDRRRYRRPIVAATATAVALTASIVGVIHLPRDTARATLTDRPAIVTDVAFSPDGQTVATASDDGTVRLWNTATGRPIGEPMTSHGEEEASYVMFSPDGQTLAVGGDSDDHGTAWLWNVATGRRIATLKGYWAFNPHGQNAASASDDGAIQLWNTVTGELITTMAGHTDRVDRVGFSPDGQLLAVGDSAVDHDTARLWNVATGHLIATLTRSLSTPPPGDYFAGHNWEFSSDGRTITTLGGDGTVRLWNTATGRLVTTLNGNTADADDAVLAPGGQTVAVFGADRVVRLWNIAAGQRITSLAYELPSFVGTGVDYIDGQTYTSAVVFGPDGRTLAAEDCGGFRLWNIATGKPVIAQQEPCLGTNTVTVWFNPDGRTLATTSDDGTVRLWNTATGHPIGEPLTGHTTTVTTVVFSPDGQTAATASHDGTARLWDIQTR